MWLRLDAGDSDPASLYYFLARAAEAAVPGSGQDLPLLTPEYAAGMAAFTHNFFSALFVRLPPGSVLVFDDVHELPDPAPLYQAVLGAVGRSTPSSRIVLVSRTGVPGPFARMRANRQVLELGPALLRLTLEEFGAVAIQAGLPAGDATLLARLHKRVDGWAAGLHILVEAARGNGFPALDPDGETPREVFEYFGSQVFQGLDGTTRSFLLKTAFLPSVTPVVAAALSGENQDRAAEILEALHRGNHFTERSRQTPSTYTYHPLFREFLQDRAHTAMGPEGVRGLKARAGFLLESEGETEAAASLFAQAREWEGLARLLLEHAPLLASQGRMQTLETWISWLPEDRCAAQPWFEYWRGVCRLPADPQAALAAFERAFRGFRAQDEPTPGALLAWAGAVEAIVWGFSDFSAVGTWLDVLPEVAESPEEVPQGIPGVRFVTGVLTALVFARPRHPDLERWEKRALQLADTCGDPEGRARLLFQLVFGGGTGGRSATAKVAANGLRGLAKSDRVPPFARIVALFGVGIEAFLYGPSAEDALAALENALRLSQDTGVRLLDFMLLGSAAMMHGVQGHAEQAETYAERMGEILPTARPWDRGLYHHVLALNALRRGDAAGGKGHAEEAIRLCIEVGNRFTEAQGRAALALSRHRAGKIGEALSALEGAARLFRESGAVYQEFDVLLARAGLLLEAHRPEEGIRLLRKALAMGRRCQFARPYGYAYPWLPMLLTQALERGIEADYARELVGRASVRPSEPHSFVENWPWRLRIYTFGRFGVTRDGAPVRGGERSSRRPFALLQALVAFGGRKVSASALGEALWPDADGDLAHRSFVTTLHRLRRLLAVPEALELRDGLLSINPRLCWVDAWAFERLWSAAERAPNDGTQKVALGRRAMDLYRGAFLEAVDEYWAVTRRERLRSRFLRGVERLGLLLEKEGKWEEAVRVYRRALEVDPLIEEFHRRLMKSLAGLGRPAEVAAAYRNCERTLRGALGIEPSAETRSVFERAIRR
ncbi:MAG: hypothetical protein GXP50_04125 [Deltaproteobacteria bacterium]|nr:hypothetical protein [Deltaproteobacteria bacterium]